jgi:hypothetical protein
LAVYSAGIAWEVFRQKNEWTEKWEQEVAATESGYTVLMVIRNFCEFEADFPSEGKLDKRGKVISSVGRYVGDALAAGLKTDSMVLVHSPESHSDYWEFSFKLDYVTRVLLSPGPYERWLLIVKPRVSFLSRIFCRGTHLRIKQVMDRIHLVLSTDRRFANILWYRESEFWKRMPGHAAP